MDRLGWKFNTIFSAQIAFLSPLEGELVIKMPPLQAWGCEGGKPENRKEVYIMGIKKTIINGKQYIALGEFDHLRRNLVRDIYDKYEKDEKGQIHLSLDDMGRVDAYAHIMTAINEDEIRAADSPEDIKRRHERLRSEWMDGKYMITAKDAETGDTIYFRKMCGEDGDTPTFTTQKRKALEYDDHYHATNFLAYLNNKLGDESDITDLRIVPLYMAYMTEAEAKKLMDALFREDEDDGSGVGQAFSPDKEG